MELDMFENPGWFGDSRGHSAAARKGWKTRRGYNPIENPLSGLATVKDWTMDIGVMQAAGGIGGLAAATMIPGAIVKDTTTTGKKFLKLLVGFGCAVGAGALGNAMVSREVGQAAVVGGLAGLGASALGAFTSVQIGAPTTRRMLPTGGIRRYPAPPYKPEFAEEGARLR